MSRIFKIRQKKQEKSRSPRRYGAEKRGACRWMCSSSCECSSAAALTPSSTLHRPFPLRQKEERLLPDFPPPEKSEHRRSQRSVVQATIGNHSSKEEQEVAVRRPSQDQGVAMKRKQLLHSKRQFGLKDTWEHWENRCLSGG
ncbi:hypothetical protein BDV96DRAFT_689578 [Lophiotrema nucula]|uniref:Uncharacterized protein n=1 Tax=Lophiotrema nucula TaxID=690887 RepID=A0A6A5YYU0_9PLEO|nr:hypothetical protein BDV96DRAFT_689578 [Lophiotrema nucula]